MSTIVGKVKRAGLVIWTSVAGEVHALRLEFNVQGVYEGVPWIHTTGREGWLSCDVDQIAALANPTTGLWNKMTHQSCLTLG